MDAIQGETADKLATIFMPFAMARKRYVQDNKIKFVHYTSADNAIRILREKSVIMRNTVCMNDYREFEHGLDFLVRFFQAAENKKLFYDAVNSCQEGAAEEALKLFDGWLPHNRYSVYVTCFSEHTPSDEPYGRLSMWRAYGRGSVGVAMVLRDEPFWLNNSVLAAYASPVAYLRNDQFNEEILKVIANVNENCAFLQTVPRPNFVGTIFNTIMSAAVCSKHPGFEEEREWRIIYLPKLSASKILERSVATINGVPQTIYKIPLKDQPAEGLTGIAVPDLLDKLIIGPSVFPAPLYDAFVSELKEAGVPNAENKVVISDIPLRSSPN